MALAVVNAIPDFHQDRLVGKRNLVVRLGRGARRRALPGARRGAASPSSPSASLAGVFPWRASLRCSALPLLVASAPRARAHLQTPRRFRPGDAQHRRLLRSWRCAVHAGHPACRPACDDAPHRSALRRAAASCPGSSRATATSLPALLHRIRAGQAPARRARRATRRCASPTRSSRSGVPYVMLCGGEPLVVPHFLAVAEALGRAGRAAQDRDQRPALRRGGRASASRGCRSARSR